MTIISQLVRNINISTFRRKCLLFHRQSLLKSCLSTISLDIPSLQDYALSSLDKYNFDRNRKSFNVYNPANGNVIGKLPSATSKDVEQQAIASMSTFQNVWKHTTGKERSAFLKKMATLLDFHRDGLAKLITLESGKPISESYGELSYASSFYELYSEEAKRINGELLSSPMKGQRLLTIREPVGPAALITPWNFPAAMITRKLGPALAAGCTAIIKPSEETPFTAIALSLLAEEAGLPSAVVSILPCSRDDVTAIGQSICHNSSIRKISFTGSTNVGKWLMKESSVTMKKVSFELGGSAPFIVFEDADVEVAIKALISSKFRNAGQACIASNRILVHKNIYDKFASTLADHVSSLNVGNGLEKSTQIGPLINRKGLEKVASHVNDSLKKGAKLLTGGNERIELNTSGGSFFSPTVLTGITREMLPFKEETFGPLAPLMSFESDDEAISIANDTRFGLAAYLCTKDLARSWRVSEALEFGMIGLNEGGISHAVAPFGGIKESGIGREGGSYGLNEYLEYKYVCMGLGK